MAKLTNNEEVGFVSLIFSVGALAVYLSQQTWIPVNFKIPVVGLLSLIAFFTGTFWAVYVNAGGNPAAVPLPPQVAGVPQGGVSAAATQTQKTSSDAQAATKS